jgi:hypothetical protein
MLSYGTQDSTSTGHIAHGQTSTAAGGSAEAGTAHRASTCRATRIAAGAAGAAAALQAYTVMNSTCSGSRVEKLVEEGPRREEKFIAAPVSGFKDDSSSRGRSVLNSFEK